MTPYVISDDEARFFHENGYLIVRGVLHGEELTRVQSAMQELYDYGSAEVPADPDYGYGKGHVTGNKTLARIEYELKPMDIVLLWTGTDRKLHSKEYFEQPGMGRDSTLWLVQEKGIKVIGIDAFGFDRPFRAMREDFERTGDGRWIWPAHFAGIEAPYCQIEKLANLESIGRPHGFKVSCFPIKVKRASAGFARVVAFVDDA